MPTSNTQSDVDYAVVYVWLAICYVYTTILTVTAVCVAVLLRKRRFSLKSQRPSLLSNEKAPHASKAIASIHHVIISKKTSNKESNTVDDKTDKCKRYFYRNDSANFSQKKISEDQSEEFKVKKGNSKHDLTKNFEFDKLTPCNQYDKLTSKKVSGTERFPDSHFLVEPNGNERNEFQKDLVLNVNNVRDNLVISNATTWPGHLEIDFNHSHNRLTGYHSISTFKDVSTDDLSHSSKVNVARKGTSGPLDRHSCITNKRNDDIFAPSAVICQKKSKDCESVFISNTTINYIGEIMPSGAVMQNVPKEVLWPEHKTIVSEDEAGNIYITKSLLTQEVDPIKEHTLIYKTDSGNISVTEILSYVKPENIKSEDRITSVCNFKIYTDKVFSVSSLSLEPASRRIQAIKDTSEKNSLVKTVSSKVSLLDEVKQDMKTDIKATNNTFCIPSLGNHNDEDNFVCKSTGIIASNINLTSNLNETIESETGEKYPLEYNENSCSMQYNITKELSDKQSNASKVSLPNTLTSDRLLPLLNKNRIKRKKYPKHKMTIAYESDNIKNCSTKRSQLSKDFSSRSNVQIDLGNKVFTSSLFDNPDSDKKINTECHCVLDDFNLVPEIEIERNSILYEDGDFPDLEISLDTEKCIHNNIDVYVSGLKSTKCDLLLTRKPLLKPIPEDIISLQKDSDKYKQNVSENGSCLNDLLVYQVLTNTTGMIPEEINNKSVMTSMSSDAIKLETDHQEDDVTILCDEFITLAHQISVATLKLDRIIKNKQQDKCLPIKTENSYTSQGAKIDASCDQPTTDKRKVDSHSVCSHTSNGSHSEFEQKESISNRLLDVGIRSGLRIADKMAAIAETSEDINVECENNEMKIYSSAENVYKSNENVFTDVENKNIKNPKIAILAVKSLPEFKKEGYINWALQNRNYITSESKYIKDSENTKAVMDISPTCDIDKNKKIAEDASVMVSNNTVKDVVKSNEVLKFLTKFEKEDKDRIFFPINNIINFDCKNLDDIKNTSVVQDVMKISQKNMENTHKDVRIKDCKNYSRDLDILANNEKKMDSDRENIFLDLDNKDTFKSSIVLKNSNEFEEEVRNNTTENMSTDFSTKNLKCIKKEDTLNNTEYVVLDKEKNYVDEASESTILDQDSKSSTQLDNEAYKKTLQRAETTSKVVDVLNNIKKDENNMNETLKSAAVDFNDKGLKNAANSIKLLNILNKVFKTAKVVPKKVEVKPLTLSQPYSEALDKKIYIDSLATAQEERNNSVETGTEMDVSSSAIDSSILNKTEGTNYKVKNLRFKDGCLNEVNGKIKRISIIPFKKNSFDEAPHINEDTKKGFVIPPFLKDVPEDVKELINDLVKPMADVTLKFDNKEPKKLFKKASTCSTQIQANIVTSSQVDLLEETSDNILKDISIKLNGILKPYDQTIAESVSDNESTNTELEQIKFHHSQTILFDPRNPLNNVLIGPINNDVHNYKQLENKPSVTRITTVSFKNIDTDSDYKCINQYNVHHVIPEYSNIDLNFSSKNKSKKRSNKLNDCKLFSIDQAVDTIKDATKEKKINTLIAMQDNRKLLSISSSLTLIDSSSPDTQDNSVLTVEVSVPESVDNVLDPLQKVSLLSTISPTEFYSQYSSTSSKFESDNLVCKRNHK